MDLTTVTGQVVFMLKLQLSLVLEALSKGLQFLWQGKAEDLQSLAVHVWPL